MSNIVIKLIVSEVADPELHELLSGIYPRRRAERVRQLALNGLNGGFEHAITTKTAMGQPEQTPTLVLKEKENEAENNTETNMLFDDMPEDFE